MTGTRLREESARREKLTCWFRLSLGSEGLIEFSWRTVAIRLVASDCSKRILFLGRTGCGMER